MWVNLLVGLLLSAVSYLLRPPPPEPKAQEFDESRIPKTREGEEIGRVYGTVWIKDAHVHWAGDFDTEPVKTDQPKK